MTDEINTLKFISVEAMSNWSKIKSDKPLNIELTKDDYDNLFMGIRESVTTQMLVLNTVLQMRLGDAENFHKMVRKFEREYITNYNRINDFIESAMLSAREKEAD